MDSGGARPAERAQRTGMKARVLADQRAVEVAGDRLDVAREVVRELQPCGFVRNWTSASRSLFGSEPYDLGMTSW